MPIKYFGKKKQEELVSYIEDQIVISDAERQELLDDLTELNDVYEGRLKEKTFPWTGASNIQVPLISTHVDATTANLMNSIFQHEPFWMVSALVPGLWPYCKQTEQFMQYVSNHVIHIYDFCQAWFKALVKDGTAVAHVAWRERYRWRYRKVDDEYTMEPKLIFRGPVVEHVTLEDFHIPSRYTRIQDAPWVGHDFYLSWPEIAGLEMVGEYDNTKDIRHSPDAEPTDQDVSRAEGSGIDLTTQTDIYKLRQVHLLWDMKDDGKHIPITVIYHPGTGIVMRADYYPYEHCNWNYVAATYVPKEKSFYGIGIPHMLRYLQTGLDDFVNNTIDNSMIANTRFFKAKKHAVENNQKVYPGAVLWCDDPATDLIVEQLGSTYGDISNYIVTMERWAQNRDAMTENMMGQESSISKTKATATGTLALIQQSTRRLDMTLRDIRNASTEIGYQILELYQQFSPGGIIKYIIPELQAADRMQEFTEQPFVDGSGQPLDFRDMMLVELSASRASLNREVEKVNIIQLQQQMMGYYKQLMELGMQLGNPQLPPQVTALVGAICEASRQFQLRVLETFQVPDAKLMIPNIEEIYGLQANAQQAAVGGNPPGAGIPGAPGPAPVGGGQLPIEAMQGLAGLPGAMEPDQGIANGVGQGGGPMQGGPGRPPLEPPVF